VLAWIEVGDPTRDEEFLTRVGDGLRAQRSVWVR
jgi:hypothetical protein